uniref:Uncharacterized protein n=1 Tax=Branchiostoma floridae TaxID=7739 RepID=C3ZAT3_BRAFL|eukprot:XP_002593959.1 hypothetical protein BRAFLDRAFT_68604 [Branchiostoma floridae]
MNDGSMWTRAVIIIASPPWFGPSGRGSRWTKIVVSSRPSPHLLPSSGLAGRRDGSTTRVITPRKLFPVSRPFETRADRSDCYVTMATSCRRAVRHVSDLGHLDPDVVLLHLVLQNGRQRLL